MQFLRVYMSVLSLLYLFYFFLIHTPSRNHHLIQEKANLYILGRVDLIRGDVLVYTECLLRDLLDSYYTTNIK